MNRWDQLMYLQHCTTDPGLQRDRLEELPWKTEPEFSCSEKEALE